MPLQLVETSDEDSFVSVAQHVSELLNEGQVRTGAAQLLARLPISLVARAALQKAVTCTDPSNSL